MLKRSKARLNSVYQSHLSLINWLGICIVFISSIRNETMHRSNTHVGCIYMILHIRIITRHKSKLAGGTLKPKMIYSWKRNQGARIFHGGHHKWSMLSENSHTTTVLVRGIYTVIFWLLLLL